MAKYLLIIVLIATVALPPRAIAENEAPGASYAARHKTEDPARSMNPVDKNGFHGFDDEGWFVRGPEYAGNYIGYAVSTPLVLIPMGATFAFSGADADASIKVGNVMCKAVTKSFGAALGSPFYLIKKAFWDGPAALYDSCAGNAPGHAGGKPLN